MAQSLRNGVLVLALCLTMLPNAARVRASSASAPLVTAFALHGWVYVVRSDGKPIRLTVGTHAVEPVLSPDRSQVAYFTTIHSATDRYGGGVLRGIWTAGTHSNAQHLVANLQGTGGGALEWSPDSRSLAFVHGRQVGVWQPGTGAPFNVTLSRTFAFTQPAIAWSYDSRNIAVPLPPASTRQTPRDLSVFILHTRLREHKTIKVTFPVGTLGSPTSALGSHPDSSQIAWDRTGTALVVATTTNGAGNGLTGTWAVAARGGTAALILGNPARRAGQPFPPAFTSATHIALSPGGAHWATDPSRRFWVTSYGVGGHFLPTSGPVGCVISQWRWLVTGQGLAYVSLCTTSGSAPKFRATLYIMPASLPGRSRAVDSTVGTSMTDLSLSPAVRCIACG